MVPFDIFKRQPAGSVRWFEVVTGLEDAKKTGPGTGGVWFR
jgi:hypothetical protein